MAHKTCRLTVIAGLVCVLSTGTYAGAQRRSTEVTSPSPSLKFALLDMARVLREWEEVKALSKRLTSHGCEYQDKIDPQQEQVKLLDSKIAVERNPQEKEKLLSTRKRLVTDLQARFQKLKDDLANNEKDQFEVLKQRVQEAIDGIAANKGLDIIIEKQWVYYPRTNLDITDDVLRFLRAKSANK